MKNIFTLLAALLLTSSVFASESAPANSSDTAPVAPAEETTESDPKKAK